jgi:hypothetical protein
VNLVRIGLLSHTRGFNDLTDSQREQIRQNNAKLKKYRAVINGDQDLTSLLSFLREYIAKVNPELFGTPNTHLYLTVLLNGDET